MSYYKLYQYDELYHHGIQGQKWGVRRYQNEDGSLTEEGRIHYYGRAESKAFDKSAHGYQKALNKTDKVRAKADVKRARYGYKMDRLKQKLNGNEAHDARIQSKIDKSRSKYEEANAVYNKGAKVAEDLVKQAQKSGYTVSSNDVLRYSDLGKDAAAYIIAGIPGMAVRDTVNASAVYKTGDSRLSGFSYGTEYHVKRS